eukprot:gene17737-20207_t
MKFIAAFFLVSIAILAVQALQDSSNLTYNNNEALGTSVNAVDFLGGTWIECDQYQGMDWFDIAISSSGKNQTAVDSKTGLYHSTDYGVSWYKSSAPDFTGKVNQYYQAVAVSGTGQYISAVVIGGPLYISSDYGVTWTNVTTLYAADHVPATAMWNDVTVSQDGKYMGAVILGGHTYVSRNYGLNWAVGMFQDSPGSPYSTSLSAAFFSIAVDLAGDNWAVGSGGDSNQKGRVYVSAGQFGYFQPIAMPGYAFSDRQQWVGVAISGNGRNISVVNAVKRGGFYQSSDYGATFTLTLNAPNVTSFSKVAMSADSQVQAVFNLDSKNGNVYLSTNNGVSWNATKSGDWLGISMNQLGNFMAGANYGTGLFTYLPNCPGGSIHIGYNAQGDNPCVPCPAGTYEEFFGAPVCTECDAGTYSTSTGNLGEETCEDCAYPWTTLGNGKTKCPVLWINAGLIFILLFCGALAASLTLIFLFGNDNQLVALIIMGFPALNVLTDLTYLLISRFYNLAIFIICVLFFMHPLPMFLYKLVKYQAWPYSIRYIWWIGAATSFSASATRQSAANPADIARQGDHIPYPTFLGRRFSLLISFENHDNLYVVVLEMFTWIVAVALQALTLVALPAFLAFWLCVGVFLQMTKTIAMSNVWNYWFYIWTGYTHWSDKPGAIDTEDLNYALLCQFCLETIPHIILQSVNNTLLGTWVSDPIAIFSLIVSIFMAVATIYKYLYHVGIRADRVDMRDVPLDQSVTLKFMFTKIEYTILNAKLEPHSRVIIVPTSEQLKFSDHKFASSGNNAGTTATPNPLLSSQDVPQVVGGSAHTPPEAVYLPPPVLYSSQNSSQHSIGAVLSGSSTPSAPPQALASQDASRGSFRASITVPYVPSTISPTNSSQNLATHSATTTPRSSLFAAGANSPASSECPPELVCPLTRRLMTDPVICADGHTYERSAIQQHFQSQRELLAQIGHPTAAVTSPITKESLDSEQLFPNRALSALLAKYNNGV